MSAISIFPLIFGISAVKAQSQPTRAKGSLLRRLSERMQTVADRFLPETVDTTAAPEPLRPVTALREQFQINREEAKRALETQSLAVAEVERLATVIAAEQTPFVWVDSRVDTAVEILSRAASPGELVKAQHQFIEAIEMGHTQVFTHELTLACERAARSLGFQAKQAGKRNGRIRVVASDDKGRSLVSEISTDAGLHTRVETEVVGVRDGSCSELLNAFDSALEREGVQCSRRERKTTGGICTLAAAQEFFGRVLRKPTVPNSTASQAAPDAGQRTRRLNTRQLAKVRRSQ